MSTDEEIQEWSSELTRFGLTHLQAKIYLSLLTYGSASVRDLSQILHIHRAEAHRVLKELNNLGMVNENLSRPITFTAFEPKKALESLILQEKQKIENLSELKENLSQWFNKVSRRRVSQKVEREKARFTLIFGRPRIYDKIIEMLNSAEKEVLRILTANGLRRNVIRGLKPELRCVAREVNLRTITDICHDNLSEAEELSKIAELRHYDGASSRLTVVDDKETIIGATFRDYDLTVTSRDDTTLWTNDREVVKSMKLFFEELWKSSVDAKIQIESLKKTKKEL